MRNQTHKVKTGRRGHFTRSDNTVLSALLAKSCKVCGNSFTRIRYQNGRMEELKRFSVRKTCGRPCKRLLITGRGNPNQKGIFPICCFCSKSLKTYPLVGKSKGRFCRDCFVEIRTETPKKYFAQRLDDIEKIARKLPHPVVHYK